MSRTVARFTRDRIYVKYHHISPQMDLGSDLGLWSAYSFNVVSFRAIKNYLAYNHTREIYRAIDQETIS